MNRLKVFKYFSDKCKQKNNPASDGSDEILIQRKNLKSYFNFIISKTRKKNKKNNIELSKGYNKVNSHESTKDTPFQSEKGLTKSSSIWNKFTVNKNSNKNSNNINTAKTVNNLNKLTNEIFKEPQKGRKSFCFIKNNTHVERTKLHKIGNEDHKKKGIVKTQFLKQKNNKNMELVMPTQKYTNHINHKTSEKNVIPSPNKDINIFKNKLNKMLTKDINKRHTCKMEIKKANPINVDKDIFNRNKLTYNKPISSKDKNMHTKKNKKIVDKKRVLNNIQSKTHAPKQKKISQIDPQDEILMQCRLVICLSNFSILFSSNICIYAYLMIMKIK
ncbi:rac-beta serine/threonine protein kinase, putative [Plasmodium vinckei brucechwatti]|uniref:Rac-beta serine/threonine protein kinase, putative n=1 Tax=Plasmodium vinckei brucechwatti TaxID=119398 RepID=A0A6V7T204_PLAVN|nr:rac-beta serine/threonine protein kinase, putative [Plasmodium vinckei brucechwatti]